MHIEQEVLTNFIILQSEDNIIPATTLSRMFQLNNTKLFSNNKLVS